MRKSDTLGKRLWRAVATIRVVAVLGVAVPYGHPVKLCYQCPTKRLSNFHMQGERQ